jgi:hypothetical protein
MWRRVLLGVSGDRLASKTITRQRGRLQALIVFAALVAMLQAQATYAQLPSPPVHVTAVSEATDLTLYAKRGTASAPPGARMVIVDLALDPSMSAISTEDLRVLLDGRVFRCEALGSAERGYCPATVSLTRKGTLFDGHCFTGNIGGMQIDASGLRAVFIVPKELDLAAAQMLTRFVGGILDLESKDTAQWPFGLTARIVGVTKYDVGWLIDVEIGNPTDKALPVNPDDLRLGRSAAGSIHWRVGQGFLHDRTTPPKDGGNGERIEMLSVLPGTTRTVRATFINVSASEGDKWLLGYFSTAAIPLKP